LTHRSGGPLAATAFDGGKTVEADEDTFAGGVVMASIRPSETAIYWL
jgi:hypothetical protein